MSQILLLRSSMMLALALFFLASPAKADLQAQIDALEQRIAILEFKLQSLTTNRNGSAVYFTGVNVHIRNGTFSSDIKNGLGNLIVGYNESDTDLLPGNITVVDDKSGSHNVVIGPYHTYSSVSGLVAGTDNRITASFATVTGGQQNWASGLYASVSGGQNNIASGWRASVTGGSGNEASGAYSSVSGGNGGEASGDGSAISGGLGGVASGNFASVSGGSDGIASGLGASVTGGLQNEATGGYASVSGGHGNDVPGFASSVSGGRFNIADGDVTSISGGANCTTTGNWDWVVGVEYPGTGCDSALDNQ